MEHVDKYSNYSKTQAIRESTPLAVLIDWKRRYFRHNFLKRIPTDRKTDILDLGCGYGVFMDELRKLRYDAIEGVDISADQVEQAKAIFGLQRVTCKDAIQYLEGKQNTFGCVLAIDILEHLAYDELLAITRLVYNSLRSGGKLVLQVPNGYSLMNNITYSDLTHVRAFTPLSLEQLFLLSGFTKAPSFSEAHAPTDDLTGKAKFLLWRCVIKPLLSFYSIIAAGNSTAKLFSHNLIAVIEK
jgi:2-polyprenyl-3-methyl-5-hydroxy-6-metoxy-1,4-benzoquinol methylase